jgi:hypothetical protein
MAIQQNLATEMDNQLHQLRLRKDAKEVGNSESWGPAEENEQQKYNDVTKPEFKAGQLEDEYTS